MEDSTLNDLQRYLEYLRYNTTDFGLRLLKPFSVVNYLFNRSKYQVVFDNDNINDCYWVEKKELENFLAGKCSNKVNLRLGRAFKESGKSGFYLSLSANNLERDQDSIQKLFGLKFKNNDLFYKIVDVAFQESKSDPSSLSIIPVDNIKIYVVEDFRVDDFLEVNKFVDKGMSVKRGMGYSIEVDDEKDNEYLTISDVKTAIKMAKAEAAKDILSEISIAFPDGHKIGEFVKNVIKKHLF